jgi:hypothetical protein
MLPVPLLLIAMISPKKSKRPDTEHCPQCGGEVRNGIDGHCSFVCAMAARGDVTSAGLVAEDASDALMDFEGR